MGLLILPRSRTRIAGLVKDGPVLIAQTDKNYTLCLTVFQNESMQGVVLAHVVHPVDPASSLQRTNYGLALIAEKALHHRLGPADIFKSRVGEERGECQGGEDETEHHPGSAEGGR